MSTPTVIRHALIPDGFAIVVTHFDHIAGFTATFQVYRGGLESSMPWDKEADAVREFTNYINQVREREEEADLIGSLKGE